MGINQNPIYNGGLGYLIDQFSADEGSIERRFRLSLSPARLNAAEGLISQWNRFLNSLTFHQLSHASQIDFLLLRHHLRRREAFLSKAVERRECVFRLLPFSEKICELEEAREVGADPDPKTCAGIFAGIANQIANTDPTKLNAQHLEWLSEITDALSRWQARFLGFDPEVTWWCRQPFELATKRLTNLIESRQSCLDDANVIPGVSIGRDALLKELELELIPYSPEELIAIGQREYAWCEAEMRIASHELGFGENWRAAIEQVKNTFVPPGKQANVVRELAREAIAELDARDLVTVPHLARETWRLEMMSADRQKINPFFLGGETITVSYPTDQMTHEEKLMSARGNNPNFSRATVQHELIPGHHLQMYMLHRHRKYRKLFGTPFWIEGWTIYWELLWWRLGFPRTPEERIGMLFWRMHRCVRIEFSLRFHLGELTTQECVDMLVDRVGHERANAEGEVRRSFNGLYPSLYQAAYMIGGLQFQALEREFVQSGLMSHREFHDRILEENQMPPSIMRLMLRGEKLEIPVVPEWRFDG